MATGIAGSARSTGDEPQPNTTLDHIRRLVDRARGSVTSMHELADRACGVRGPTSGPNDPHIRTAPNGLLDHIESDLRDLCEAAEEAVDRLRPRL